MADHFKRNKDLALDLNHKYYMLTELFRLPPCLFSWCHMKATDLQEFKLGRRFFGRLEHGTDIISAIETVCENNSILAASFSIQGAVCSYTIGTYDQAQHVYVTSTVKEAREIVNCQGNVSAKDAKPFVLAHIVLSDERGRITGGRLFSETVVYAGEIELQELIGRSLTRSYDEKTGRFELKR